MKKAKTKKKVKIQLIISLIAFTLTFFYFQTQVKGQTIVFYGENFNTFITSNSSLTLQYSIKNMIFQPVNASLNCTNCDLTVYSDSASLYRFEPYNSFTLKVYWDNITDVEVNGNAISNNTIVNISYGSNIIEWDSELISNILQPYLPIDFLMGIIGLIFLIVAPCYLIHAFRHGEYQNGIALSFVMGALGVGLLIAWVFG